MWRLIWGNDHLYCGFGARRSHLTLHWMSAQGSVGFRWGTITGPYHGNFSQVETQKFDPHWFYCLQWGCNNLFCQECMNQCWIINYRALIHRKMSSRKCRPFCLGLNVLKNFVLINIGEYTWLHIHLRTSISAKPNYMKPKQGWYFMGYI